MKKYFGTDGIRGIYGEFLTDKIAYLVGNCLGKSALGKKLVIGRDTRPSGKALLNSFAKGATDAGADIVNFDIISTPGIAYMTPLLNAQYGIVLSASHNPKEYNGIKVFNFEGRKLLDEEEVFVENFIDEDSPFIADRKGQILRDENAYNQYVELLKKTANFDLSGLNISLDCSNGAVSFIAPKIFKTLGANVECYFNTGDGEHINENCGALHPEVISEKTVENKSDIGFCFDGDADRIIAVDKNGKIVNGDSIIYIIGKHMKACGKLNSNAVVGTLHTNMGTEMSLKNNGIKLFRTDIGDHYVMEKMVNDDLLVGGEQSGHIILREFICTGDGLLTALYLARLVKEYGKGLEELDDSICYPQINLNIISEHKNEIMKNKFLLDTQKELEKEIGDKGRILLRKSGTEPKVRIMVECDSMEYADNVANRLKKAVEKVINELA